MMRVFRPAWRSQREFLRTVLTLTSILAVAVLLLASAPASNAQQQCSLEFVARVAPTGGHPEPVRGMTFYLLHKSFQDIQKEAAAAEPLPNENEYIDGLQFTPALKAWMKKHQIVEFSGEDFLKAMTPDDVIDIPELREAYMNRNEGDRTVNLPQPKYRATDEKKNPAKYKQEIAEYNETLKKFIAVNRDTLSTLYLAMENTNPGPRWKKMLNDRLAHVHRHALELAEMHYLAGQTDTDLDGLGRMDGLAPGDYWLSTLDGDAMSGDARVRWDMPVHVTPGRNTFQLSNLNGTDPQLP